MHSWKKIFIVGLAALLLATTAVPAFAAEDVPVTIANKTGEAVSVTFKAGGENTTVEVGKGRTLDVKLEEGNYTYKYTACGKKFIGTIAVFAPSATLRLPKCGNPEESTVVIDNRLNGPFRLVLSGTKNYSIYLPIGITKLTLVAGGYQYSAFVCGETETGVLKAKAGKSQTWVWDCN